jgi:Zn-dependent protease
MKISNKQLMWGSITFLAYAMLMGWQVAILIMIAVGFHESCHLLAAKKMKVKTGGFIFLPFMGGVSFIGRFKSLSQQAFIVLAGPIGGGALAIATFFAYLITGIPFLAASAYWMCFLNLFNLMPFALMDGGQVMNSISYSLNEKVGFYLTAISTVLATIFIFFLNPLVAIFVGLMGGYNVWREYRARKFAALGQTWMLSDAQLNKPKVMTHKQIWLTAGVWLLTVFILGALYLLLKDNPDLALTFLKGVLKK